MSNLPDSRTRIRWMFNALGFVLIFGHDFVVHSVLRADFWAGLIFGEYSPGYLLLMAAAYLYLIPAALLCWLTAYGLKSNKPWSHPVGVGTCGLLLLGFPWLTLVGAFGLYVLISASPRPSPAADLDSTAPVTDYWNSKRKSKMRPVAMTILCFAILALRGWFAMFAHRTGMPDWNPGWTWWPWFSLFLLMNTVLHESGHAILAWAAGFRLKVISMGPFTFWRDHSRFRFRFDAAQLFGGGGYMGALPLSDHGLRTNEIAVVAAGPAANALSCLVFFAVFVSLPGTEWQSWWWVAALNASIACLMAVGNLMPLGYCDGTMLFHLIFQTRPGRLLLDRKRVMRMGEEAAECHNQALVDQEIELLDEMLRRSLAFGRDNACTIAACHQALGSAYMRFDDWPTADFHYRKCLEFEGEVAANPDLRANVWSSLQCVAVRRYHTAAASAACRSTIAILEKRKGAGDVLGGPAIVHAMLAQAHLYHGDLETALAEVASGLRSPARGSHGAFARASLWQSKALCHLHLDETDSGLDATQSAASLLRSPAIPPEHRNLAWENMVMLGHELWSAGQSSLAIDLLREGIAHLELGGAGLVAALYRIHLAGILRQLGRTEQASVELPVAAPLFPALRRHFFAERAQLRLASGRPNLAVADCRELVALWRAHPCAPAPEIACAEGLLAASCLAAGNFVEAEALALQAANVLGPWRHPDAASCLITAALARALSTGENNSLLVDEGLRLIDAAKFLSPAAKARLTETQTVRLLQSPAANAVAVTRKCPPELAGPAALAATSRT